MISAEMKSAIGMALDTIRSHKTRSLLTVLGVIIGTSTVIAVGSVDYRRQQCHHRYYTELRARYRLCFSIQHRISRQCFRRGIPPQAAYLGKRPRDCRPLPVGGARRALPVEPQRLWRPPVRACPLQRPGRLPDRIWLARWKVTWKAEPKRCCTAASSPTRKTGAACRWWCSAKTSTKT